jgi:sodium-dependent dicarboxylate transporter 2/3/5
MVETHNRQDERPQRVSDERREIRRLVQRLEVRSWQHAVQVLGCVAVASGLSFVPRHAGLAEPGRWALFILILAAGLWVTEAMAAFGVALLVVGLEILLLGDLGRASDEWSRFVAPWASPLVWLFLGGFVLGKGAAKTGLDRWLARRVLEVSGTTPTRSLFGLMAVGFVLSMFMSNTAAAAMLVAIATPIAVSRPKGDPARKGIFIGVAVATNLGGMGTLIGSPPNAIAAGALGGLSAFSFTRWMLVGLPPALVLFGVSFAWIALRYRSASGGEAPLPTLKVVDRLPAWRQLIVLLVFGTTVLLWMFSGVHGIPTPVVSFLPICVFSATGILRAVDVRELQWDVLLLILGGLSLGQAVTETGLASWLVDSLPVSSLGRLSLGLAVAYATAALSNFMSNTAAANILVPIGVALGQGFEGLVAVPIALAASCAMCLPISTPPNAIVFASGELQTRDFMGIGLVLAAVAPALAVAWCAAVL